MVTTQEVHQQDSSQEALSHFQKANLANNLRLMADNQTVLDRANKRAELFFQREAAMLGIDHNNAKTDDMKIAIDSPETHNHFHGQPESAPATAATAMSPLMKLAAVGLLASGVGIPAGIAAWNLPAILAPAAQAAPAAKSLLQDYDLLVGDGKQASE